MSTSQPLTPEVESKSFSFTRYLRFGSLSGVIFILLAILVVASLTSEFFLTPYNLTIIVRTLAFVGLITIGQALLMMLGELDLSLGAIGGLIGVLTGVMIVNMGIHPGLAVPLALLLGLLCGAINGVLVTALKLHSLVLTIGMAGVYGGIILVITQGVAIVGLPETLTGFGRATIFGLPMPFFVMLLVLLVVSVVIWRTPVGRYVYAIGNNSDAARMLGIKVDRIRVCAFAFAGFLAAMAGILMVARLGSAQGSIGDGWVLAPIAAAVIGGVATSGGVGSPIGAIIGAAIIGVIENVIVLLGVSPYWQGIVSGAIVVLAISIDSISRNMLAKK